MKIYTGAGDSGESAILGGIKLPKYSLIFHILGDIDELNSYLGLCISFIKNDSCKDIINILKYIQKTLFKTGLEIQKVETGTRSNMGNLFTSDIKMMEKLLDQYSTNVEIKGFILPGGSIQSCLLHIARTICRRIERNIVKYVIDKKIKDTEIIAFFNRLSDLLYILAIVMNRRLGFKEEVV